MTNRPEDVIRDNNLKASIWKNEGEKGAYYTTTLARTYRDENGDLRDTQNFSQTDLLRISELTRNAYNRINDIRREHAHERKQEQQANTPDRAAYDEKRQSGTSKSRGWGRDR